MAFENLKKNGIAYVLTKLKSVFLQIKDAVKTVNGEEADENGDIKITSVPYAQNLQSESNQRTEETYIERTAGRSASITDGDAWLMRIRGNSVHEGYVAESIEMTVTAVDPESVTAIQATINNATFRQAVYGSGTLVLTYTMDWSENPEGYGITVTGTPVEGDEISVDYAMEERGNITVANPMSLIATGWNLYNDDVGYARVLKYSDDPAEVFGISGTYTALKFSPTLDGAQVDITVEGGHFSIPEDGYVFVTDGNSTDTAIWMTWSDWYSGYEGSFQTYTEDEVDFSNVMATYFPYGLLKAGSVVDEINFNLNHIISRVERMDYSEANRAVAAASGREYEFDEDYIYIEREEPVTEQITVTGKVEVDDHGMEIITYTYVPVEVEMLYGVNLKNKLEHDTVTKSSDLANNLTTNTSGKALDARQGKVLNDIISASSSAEVTVSTTRITANYARVTKIGNLAVVTISASVTNTININSTLLTVPSGYRPSASQRAVFAYENNGSAERYRPDYFTINSSGQISQSWSASWAAGEFEAVFVYKVG